jgi:hypothetical protein
MPGYLLVSVPLRGLVVLGPMDGGTRYDRYIVFPSPL